MLKTKRVYFWSGNVSCKRVIHSSIRWNLQDFGVYFIITFSQVSRNRHFYFKNKTFFFCLILITFTVLTLKKNIPFLPVRNKGKYSDTTIAKISALYRTFWGTYIYGSECTFGWLIFRKMRSEIWAAESGRITATDWNVIDKPINDLLPPISSKNKNRQKPR